MLRGGSESEGFREQRSEMGKTVEGLLLGSR